MAKFLLLMFTLLKYCVLNSAKELSKIAISLFSSESLNSFAITLNCSHLALFCSSFFVAPRYLYPSITATFMYRIFIRFSLGRFDRKSALKKVAMSRFTVAANAYISYKAKTKFSSFVLF